MTPLEKTIIATLSYFDIFDYPLTLMEIWKWQYAEDQRHVFTISELQTALEASDFLGQKIASKDGFYFFKNRENILAIRQARYALAEQKYHRAKRIIRFLRNMPFVKMIGVCNTLAYNNSRAEADIDIVVITQPGRVWPARFWVAGLLQAMGQRPARGDTQDKMCSTFFIDENHLSLQKLCKPGDIYLPFWISQVVPVYDEGIHQKFIEANQWVRERLPMFIPVVPSSRRHLTSAGKLKQFFTSIALTFPSLLYETIQMTLMPEKLKSAANIGTNVIINDHMLKFHDNDRRESFLKQWQQRLSEFQ
jgi:hypothetical protein